MSPAKSVCAPGCGSNQRHEPHQDQAPSRYPQPDKRGKKRARGQTTGALLKVKLPKLNKLNLSKKATKEDEAPPRWMFPISAGTECHPVGVDVFYFSQRPTSKATNEQEKGKLSVLRTISKMLEENQLIRQRLADLSHTN